MAEVISVILVVSTIDHEEELYPQQEEVKRSIIVHKLTDHFLKTNLAIMTFALENGSYNTCGSLFHWADNCELVCLHQKVWDLELQTSSHSTHWHKNSANIVESQEKPGNSSTTKDAALAEVLDICAAEIKNHHSSQP